MRQLVAGRRGSKERGGVENVSFVVADPSLERSVVVVVASTRDCGEGIQASKLFRRVEEKFCYCKQRRNEYEVSTLYTQRNIYGILVIKFLIERDYLRM